MTDPDITTSSSPTPSTADDLKAVAKLVSAARIALLTTVTSDGDLHARPLAVQQSEFDGALWFLSQEPSGKTADIAANPHVNVSLESGKGYLSIAGTASVVRDEAKVDELWSTQAEAWFPEGREDPSVALIRVDADSAEYWATDEPRAVTLFKVAKAALTGGTPDIGTNGRVEL